MVRPGTPFLDGPGLATRALANPLVAFFNVPRPGDRILHVTRSSPLLEH